MYFGTNELAHCGAGLAKALVENHSEHARTMNRLVKILAIDGGGTRGIIPAMLLAHVENVTGRPIAALFDLNTTS